MPVGGCRMRQLAGGMLIFVLLLAGAAQAQSAGPQMPGTIVNDTGIGVNPWNSPAQAATSDDVYAFAAAGVGTPTQFLKATNFGFAIPPTAVVLGIEVNVERHGVGPVFDNVIRIVKGGVIGGTNQASGAQWPAADAVATYGAPNDLWGLAWTAADINASGFGVAISAHDSISGSLARVDAISITVSYGLCGDGIQAPNEACDDGNTANGDCCSATCQFEPNGSPCPDADLCDGTETCNGAGGCVAGTPLTCSDGDVCTQDSCNPTSGCVYTGTPRGDCRTAQKGLLLIKSGNPSKDKLAWKWIKGEATSLDDLGTPTGTTAYTLCVYAGTAVAELEATIPGGPNWKPIGSKGFKYKDASGSGDGIQKALLKSGAAGKAKAQVKGKGPNLPDPMLPFTGTVTAQLVNDENDVCFTTTLGTVKKSSATQFKGKSP